VNTLSRRELLRTGSAAALGLGLGIGRRTSSSAWTTETPGPTATPVDPSLLEQLRTQLSSQAQLLLPSDGVAYTNASAPNNGRYLTTRPVAVAVCANEQDVVTCVNWCRENKVLPVARGGGHSYGGFSTVSNGLVVNIGKLNSVDVSMPGSAVVGGAALNENVFDATVNGQYFLPVGTCPKVGVGGLVLGGGIGYNTHAYGLTCDHLRETRIVTADGQVRTANANQNADLFWACRGGAGGSFGINTSFTFDLERVPDPVWYFRFDYSGADKAAQVFGKFHEILQFAPPQFNAVAFAQATDPKGGNKRDAITVRSRGQFFGQKILLENLLQPLLALSPADPTLTQYTFWDMQKVFATPVGSPHSYGDISRYANAPISNTAITNMVDLLANLDASLRTDVNNASILSLGWVGGSVVNRVKRTDTAYVHRNMLTLLRPSPVWSNDAPASVGNELMAWTKEVIAAIGPGPYESYQNFPNRDIPNWLDAYYAENLPSLKEIKTKYDGGNLFKNSQSIPTQ
jgi:hypothetical protein